MKLFSRIVAAAALVSAMVGTAAAQSSGVLNTLEVQRLAATNTAAAHLALSKHFIALAEQFATEAARFDALATVPSGNPNHPVPMVNRRGRQAAAVMELSEAARDMAVYHQLLSMGSPAAPPSDRALFDGGYGARIPSDNEVASAVAGARTAADHRALEEYFTGVAERSSAEAKTHTAMANNFRVSGQRRGSELAAMHCDRLANEARDTAKKATASAELHRQLANVG